MIPLHIIFIIDISNSMRGDKIQSLNYAMRCFLPELIRVGEENPNADILFSCVTFSRGAEWYGHTGTNLKELKWIDVVPPYPFESTDIGAALFLVADYLKLLPNEGLPPCLVLMTDGHPTDNFSLGLSALLSQRWGKKAVRIAIAIGKDADQEVLQKFVGYPDMKPLQAHNAEDLVKYIKWAPIYIDTPDPDKNQAIVTALDKRLRCVGLLRDSCSSYKGEISVLMAAFDEGVATALRATPPDTPPEMLLRQLTQRLQQDRGLSEEAACWAVESWALALGVVS